MKLCFIGLHNWIHCSIQHNNDAPIHTKECRDCDRVKPDTERKKFVNFCDDYRDSGLTTEQMRDIVRSNKY